MFSATVIEAAQRHARAEFPKESCGVVVSDVYYPCRNAAEDPLHDFVVHMGDQADAMSRGNFEGVIHSHPFVPVKKDDKPVLWPTQSDMEGQILTAVPWAIIPVESDRVGKPIIWGDQCPIRPIIGREFIPGVADCYSIIRDVFRLGKDELAKQDIPWPFDPIYLADKPRDHAWWETGGDLYEECFAKWGFKQITFSEAKPGDVFLITIGKTDKLNHGGVLVGNNLLIQHFPERLSKREPAGIWARQANKWLRYVGGDQSILTEEKA